jgi:hypothetical protein
MAESDTTTISTPKQTATAGKTQSMPPSGVFQFAQAAVSAQVGRVSEILNGTADSIDELLGGSNSPLPESAKGYVTSTSGKLRELADRATEEEASKLLRNLQQAASSHPAATMSLGAALGAALGLALAKLGGPSLSGVSSAKRPARK